MAELRVIYDDFSAGEYGHLGPAKAPANSFSGRNVVRYQTGLLGPRAGMRWRPLSGMPGGEVLGMGWSGTPGADLWWIIGNTVYSRNGSDVVQAWTPALAAAPTEGVQSIEAPTATTHMTSFGDKTYRLDHLAKTVNAIDGSPGGRSIAMMGERLFVAGTVADLARTFYTDAADLTAFPPLNFFDTGGRAAVRAIFAQRDHLAIVMQDGEWWIYRGVGSSASQRRATAGGAHPWVMNANAAALLGSDEIALMPVGTDWPATFDGVRVDEVRSAGPDGNTLGYAGAAELKVLRGFRPEECVMVRPAAGLVYLYRNGVWTLHSPSVGLSEFAVTNQQGVLHLTDGGAAGVAPKFYDWKINLDRPAFTSDAQAQPGDDTDTPLSAYFSLPEWWSKPGTEARVRQVIVDFTKWNTGAPLANHMKLELLAFGMFRNDGTEAHNAQEWEEAGNVASTSGTRDRAVFNIGDQGFGAGFQVKLAHLRGVAVRAITVVLDSQPASPRH